MRLNGKVALVTGGNAGIGEAIASLFAHEGSRVVIAARRQAQGQEVVRKITGAGGTAVFIQADIASSEDCARMVAETIKQFGRLDIAVNNAGIGRSGKLVADEEEEGFRAVVDTNLTGAFLCMKHEIPAMLAGEGGSIINVSSVSGLKGSSGQAAYVASKHGLIGLTKGAALEYAKQKVRINALCPVATRTDMLKAWFASPGVEELVLSKMPSGRVAEPSEVANAALFLASDDSIFVTGQSLAVDGGFTA